jgi:hypothetical protein
MILAYWEFLTPDNMVETGRLLLAVGAVLMKIGGLIILLG